VDQLACFGGDLGNGDRRQERRRDLVFELDARNRLTLEERADVLACVAGVLAGVTLFEGALVRSQ
jgi:hypothetical protein